VSSNRRVHRLKLRAANSDAVHHGAIVVEDALRTASLPGLPQNGLLLIRRLNLGKLAPNPTSISVAHRIASRLQTVKVRVVRQHTAEHPRAKIVWFADDVEPYAILATLLVRNIQPQSWYWPRAVKGWSTRMTPHQGLRHVLYEVSRTPAAMVAASRVVEHVICAAGAAMLGRTLQPNDGRRLLALGGNLSTENVSAKESGGRGPDQMRRLDRSWRQTLSRLVSQWGRRDDRSTWLAHVAACAHSGRPSPSGASDLMRELQQGQLSGLEPARQQLSPPPLTLDADEAEAINIAPHDGGQTEQGPNRHEPSDSIRKAGPAERINRRVPDTTDPASVPAAEPTDRTNHDDRSDLSRSKTAIQDLRSLQASPDKLVTSETTVDRHQNRRNAPDIDNGETSPTWARSTKQPVEDQPQPQLDPTGAFGEFELTGAESKHAGLVFAVQALERLGIRETLTAQPVLEAYQLPARILWHCVDQLEISHDDPICEFLPTLETVPAGISFGLALIIHAYETTMGLFLDKYARTNLRRLTTYPGQAATTHTHLDVTFDPAQLDIGIRRAGLDIDPGWVPWLGRVVYIHYRGREEIIDVQ